MERSSANAGNITQSRKSGIVCVIALSACLLFLSGCGKPLPKAYGTYVETPSGWQALAAGGIISTSPELDERPTFLIFDPQMSNPMVRQAGIAQFAKGQLIGRNIEKMVAEANGPPLSYSVETSGQLTFFPVTQSMAASPMENSQEMLMLTSQSSLPAGYYIIRMFQNVYPFRVKTGGLSAEEAAKAGQMDKWYTTIDPNAGSTWDNFRYLSQKNLGDERQFHGHSIVNIEYADARRLTEAALAAQRQCDLAANGGSIEEMCKARRVLDSVDHQAGEKAKSVCESRVRELIKTADGAGWPTVVRKWGMFASRFGVMPSDLEGIYSQALKTIFERENNGKNALTAALEDAKAAGDTIVDVPYVEKLYPFVHDGVATATANSIKWSGAKGSFLQPGGSSWFGDIFQVDTSARNEFMEKGTNYYVQVSKGAKLTFTSAENQDHFVSALVKARQAWSDKYRNAFYTEVVAPPQEWSERVYIGRTPFLYSMEEPKSPIEVQEDEGGPVTDDGSTDLQLNDCDWIKFRSKTNASARLKLQRFPFKVTKDGK